MSSTTANSSIKCEEHDISFTSQQGLDQHKSMPLIEGKVAAGNNICRECVSIRYIKAKQKNSYHTQDLIWAVL
jgi:hypothetical protein